MENCRLGQLLDTLGEPALRLLTPPAGRSAPVTEALLHDPQAALPHTPGGLLLAVGVRSSAAGPLVREAAAAGLAAVVVRGADGPVTEAKDLGIALLAVDDDASWHRVHLLLASAIGARQSAGAAGSAHSALGDLFALANALAAAVGGATAVEDPRQRILAYSTVPGQSVDDDRRTGILGLQVPASPENTEQYRTLFATARPVRLPALDGQLPRLAVAVRAGGETLGSVWIVDDGHLAKDAEDALTQGAATAALHLLRARAAEELTRHQYGDLLRRLLDGTADPASAAPRLGLAEDDRVRVVAVTPHAAASAPDGEQTALRLLDLVRLQCEAHYGRHACVLVDGTVYALLPVRGERGGERHKRLAQDIVRRAGQALRTPMRAGLGAVVPELAQVTASRDDADHVLRVIGPDTAVATVDEVRPRVTLLRLAEVLGGRQDLAKGAWSAVLAYDAEHGTEYARTLICYFDARCDMAGAARLLAVHPNTCRYRLKQAQQHLGLDLDDPDERLVLWLHLRVLGKLRGTGVV